jgi:hypothetical protein
MQEPANMPFEVMRHERAMKPVSVSEVLMQIEQGKVAQCPSDSRMPSVWLNLQESTVYQFHSICQ